MQHADAKLLIAYILATVLASGLALVLVRRVRATLVRLMRAPLATGTEAGSVATTVGVAQATVALPAWLAPTLPDAARWRRAQWRLFALVAGLSLLIAATRGAIVAFEAFGGSATASRWLSLSVFYAWPMLPALGLMRRWNVPQLALALLAWFGLSIPFALWRVDVPLPVILAFLGFELVPPGLALLVLTARGTRAAAPWLWLPIALLVVAGLLGLDALAWLITHAPGAITFIVATLPPIAAFALFAAAGVALAWWPVARLSRALARLYSGKRVSDLMVVFSAAWVLNLGFDAINNTPLVLLPLLWIPLALWAWPRLTQAPRDAARAPTLLVLRVFQQDKRVNDLFDDVVERWRAVGNTVLIAGTDLVQQTLDVADLLDFVEGRLAQRFVWRAADVPARLADFDWRPDPDGRHRVNECYCHDSGWQVALAALVNRADLVLMDLRGFQARNAGCRFELGVLARAAHLKRAVVLTDASTDLLLAQSEVAAAPPGRFAWTPVPPSLSRRRGAARVIDALAAAGDPPARVTATALAS